MLLFQCTIWYQDGILSGPFGVPSLSAPPPLMMFAGRIFYLLGADLSLGYFHPVPFEVVRSSPVSSQPRARCSAVEDGRRNVPNSLEQSRSHRSGIASL